MSEQLTQEEIDEMWREYHAKHRRHRARCLRCGRFAKVNGEMCFNCGCRDRIAWLPVVVTERRRMGTFENVGMPKIKVGGDTIGGEI